MNKEYKLKNLGKLSKILERYEKFFGNDFKKFIKYLIKIPENKMEDSCVEENSDVVKVMTIHQSKGLEFPVVFVCGLNNKMWLKKRNFKKLIDIIPEEFLLNHKKYNEYEEELRVLYVAMSRAQDILVLFESKEKSKIIKEVLKNNEYYENIEDIKEKVRKHKRDIKEPLRANFSALNQYLICPYLYYMIYELEFESPEIFEQIYGRSIHNCFKNLHFLMKSKKDITKEDIKEIVKLSIDNKISKFKNKFESVLWNYYKKYRSHIKEILYIEYPISKVYEGFILEGKVDIIFKDKNNNIVLMDLKSRKAEGIEITHIDIQLNLYKEILKNEFPNLKLKAYSIEDNEIRDIKTRDDIDRILEMFKKNRNSKRKNKNPFCKKCIFKDYCDASKKI